MARLTIFEGEWDPAPFELEDRVHVVMGRARDADRVLPIDRVGRRHLRLDMRGGRWELSDLGNGNGTCVNGEPVRRPRVLQHEDLISVLELGIVFEERDELRNPELEAAIVDRPRDPRPIAVWADWLIEHGDPLGERLALAARGAPVQAVMRGALDGDGNAWRGDLSWRHGLLESVELRSWGHSIHWRPLIARLLRLRSARFLRSLRVDLLGLCGSGVDVEAEAATLVERLPPSLEKLDLGYGLDRPSLVLSPAQAARLPRLKDRQVFFGRMRAKLLHRSKAWDVTGELSIDVRPGQTPALSRRGPATPGGRPDYDQATFFREAGTWTLRVPISLQRSLKVNGKTGYAQGLLPGDTIEIDGAVFRFECE